MIDHVVGFMTSFRTHDVDAHVNAAVGLAKTVKIYDVPLLVTGGEDTDPSGPRSSALKVVLGDTDVIVRRGNFNAFDTPSFVEALEATGRRTLLMSGLMTEGNLSDTEYRRCAPGEHIAAGRTTTVDGRPMSINVEEIGGQLVATSVGVSQQELR